MNRISFLHPVKMWNRVGWVVALAALIAAFWAGTAPVLAAGGSSKNLPLVTSIQDFYRLSTSEAGRGYPIRLRATVLFIDPRWHMLFIEDANGQMYTTLPESGPELRDGDRIEIQAVSALKGTENILEIQKIGFVGHGDLPAPRPGTIPDLSKSEFACRRIIENGMVVSSAEVDRHLFLTVLVSQRYFLEAEVRDFPGGDLGNWIDSRVTITGLNVTDTGTNTRARMVVSSVNDVVVWDRGVTDRSQLPLKTIADLQPLWGGTNNSNFSTHMVRLRAKVISSELGKGLAVEDETGRLDVICTLKTETRTNDLLELVGFPTFDVEGNPGLIAHALKLLNTSENISADLPSSPLPLLGRAAEIHRLTPKEADKGYPVQIRATVTYYDREWRNLYVQDESGPVYVDTEQEYSLKPGDVVYVSGISGSGGYAPLIRKPVIRFIKSEPVLEPARVTFDEVATGRHDCRWIQLSGIIRSYSVDGTHSKLEVQGEGGQFEVNIPELPAAQESVRLVDSEVSFRAVCTTKANQDRQLIGISLVCPAWSYVTFEKLGAENPFETPVQPIRNLLQFSMEGGKHRVRIEGVITLVEPNQIVVQDSTGAIWLDGKYNYWPGQKVEVIGFPVPGECSPVLKNPTVKPVGSAPIPDALYLEPVVLLRGTNDAQRVRVRGRLLEYLPGKTQAQMALQALKDDFIFNANIEKPRSGSIAPGTVVEVEGICKVRADAWHNMQSARILVASGNHVRVLATPAWWTRRDAPLILAGLTLVLAVAFAWGIALRRQVSVQTSVIRRQLEQAVTLEHRYRELFENASDAIYTIDLEGQCTRFNHAAETAFGYCIEEGTRLSHAKLYLPESFALIDRALEALLRKGVFPVIQVEAQAQGGQRRILELKARAIHEHGKLAGFQFTARDITERQQLEKKFLQAQKMEAVGQLAGGIAHDFNNLLTVIIGNAALLNEDSSNPADNRELSGQISQAADRAAKLTRQLLTFSRKQILQVDRINLNDTLSGITRMLGRILGEHITLQLDCGADLPEIDADSGMLEQVIMNLSVNARDAMPKGGRLTISTRKETITAVESSRNSEAREGEFVALSVADTGSGIKREMIPRLFEPFFTTKDVGKGTGLGLATVYGIVKKHDGWIEVASELGRGSVFTVYLPVAKDGVTG